jgi:hypothetical protein
LKIYLLSISEKLLICKNFIEKNANGCPIHSALAGHCCHFHLLDGGGIGPAVPSLVAQSINIFPCQKTSPSGRPRIAGMAPSDNSTFGWLD